MAKLALITGSTSGIGLSIAELLASKGFNIVINGLGDEQQIKQLCLSISEKNNVSVSYHPANMNKKEEIKDLIDYCKKNFQTIDVLINNAGIQYVSPIEQFPDEKWDQILNINLTASFHTIKNTLPLMKEKGWGRIINIASTHGLIASANKSAYVAAKHGIIGLTKVTALETAGMGITCNAICPGWVLTPLVQQQIDTIAKNENITNEQATVKLLSEKQPSKIFTKPSDIAEMVVFLTGEAGNNITGASMILDGAWTAQ